MQLSNARFLLAGLMVIAAVSAGASPTAAPSSNGKTMQGAVRIDAIVPRRFSILDGTLQGDIEGVADTPVPVNLFGMEGNAPEGGWKLSPWRFNAGTFRFPSNASLSGLIPRGVATFFISPSETGTHLPSSRVVYAQQIVLPAPEIISATSSRTAVTLHGKALPGARVDVKVAGQSHRATSSGHTGDWSHTFTGVPQGSYLATAQVVDTLGYFPASAWASREVVSEGDITRPLVINSPAPGFPVNRRFYVHGVASPSRGPVHVSVGDGAVVEASVNPVQHIWSALVISATHGMVPLTVTLPGTGERVTQTVQVAPFSDLVVDRLVRYLDRSRQETRLIAKGTVSLSSLDTEVRFLNRNQDWTTLASADEEGAWEYQGTYPLDIYVRAETIDGVRHREVARFSVPSLGDHPRDSVPVPLVRAGPELTSPLRVATTTILEGYDPSGTGLFPVTLILPDGTALSAVPDRDGRWSMPVSDLSPGRQVIELGKSIPSSLSMTVETNRYTLDVVESP